PAGDGPHVSLAQAACLWAQNILDWPLYAHLNRSVWHRAEAGAEPFRPPRLCQCCDALARHCLRGGRPLPARAIANSCLRPFQPLGQAQILVYALRAGLPPAKREHYTCLATPELQYKDILYRRQFRRATPLS
ncbi:G3ST4 sulfotransferase, partial [Ibidorhyncha struthersii]|nr:G3ST4 sulfotransferase [Ibidorhyncha struthersii]